MEGIGRFAAVDISVLPSGGYQYFHVCVCGAVVHPINTFYYHTMSTHPVNIPCHPFFHHSLSPPFSHTLLPPLSLSPIHLFILLLTPQIPRSITHPHYHTLLPLPHSPLPPPLHHPLYLSPPSITLTHTLTTTPLSPPPPLPHPPSLTHTLPPLLTLFPQVPRPITHPRCSFQPFCFEWFHHH